MACFMSNGRYHTWQSQEENPHRIEAVHDRDPDCPAADAPNHADVMAELLAKRRRQLRTFIGQVAKAASKNMYVAIARHSTSLKWVYNSDLPFDI